jgi:hypothetical protein
MKLEGSLPCQKEPTIKHYPEPLEFPQHPQPDLFKIKYHIFSSASNFTK